MRSATEVGDGRVGSGVCSVMAIAFRDGKEDFAPPIDTMSIVLNYWRYVNNYVYIGLDRRGSARRHVPAQGFFTREVAPLEEKFRKQGHPEKELYARAGELGLCGMAIPEEYGGGGGDFANLALSCRNRPGPVPAAWASPSARASSPTTCWPTGPRSRSGAGCPAVQRRMVGAIAMTEPGTGSDLQAIARPRRARRRRLRDQRRQDLHLQRPALPTW